MKVLHIDLGRERLEERPLADPLAGGRLLTDQIISEGVPPEADPLGPENLLVFAGGALAGHRVSTGGRLSIGGKSPLTGGIKESNAGGMAGDSLAVLGYRALVFSGVRPLGAPALFVLDETGGRFLGAKDYWGLGNETLVEKLFADFGRDYVIISIGPAGEQALKAAGIAVTDLHGKPFRLAARGGLGAVMGRKGLKAILLQRADLGRHQELGAAVKQATTDFNRFVAGSDRVKVLRDYGTASTVMPVVTLAGLPVRNFSRGELPGAEQLSGETMRDLILERGGVGNPTEACMAGCVIQCSNVFPDKDGQLAAAPVEFETIGLCGSNLGLTALDEVARLNRLCNDLGLDTIEIGAGLGVMMEAAEAGSAPVAYAQFELPRFGQAARALALVAEIGSGTPLATLLGQGVVAVGRALGVAHIPAVKGQALSAYDPRIVKGTGVTYATSPQGADHTAGLTIFAPIDHKDRSTAVKASRAAQLQRAAYDALGLCVFNLGATGRNPALVLSMLQTIYNVTLAEGWLDELGRRVIDLELDFNRAAGFTPEDDRLPSYFESEPLPPVNSVFDVPHAELDAIWDAA
jgi:aldehyde:ferredoxin oxidoreductase